MQATGLYVVINGAQNLDGKQIPIRPRVSYVGQPILVSRRHSQNAGERYLGDSRIITSVTYELSRAGLDEFDLLAEEQPFVQAGKVPKGIMRKVLREFYKDIWERYELYAELLDTKPELRNGKFILPSDKYALLYKGPWRVVGIYRIDVSGMNPEKDLVAVTVPNHGMINEDWRTVTGLAPDTFHYHWLSDSRTSDYPDLDGLDVLRLRFRLTDVPYLHEGSPLKSYGATGILVGSTQPIEELVTKFNVAELEQLLENPVHRFVRRLTKRIHN